LTGVWLIGVWFTGACVVASWLIGVWLTGVWFTGVASWLKIGAIKADGGTSESLTRGAPALTLGTDGVRLRFVAIGGCTVCAQGENSEVSPPGPVAVAVTNWPDGSAATFAVKVPVPPAFVVVVVVPR
jgi:hypothetical protein